MKLNIITIDGSITKMATPFEVDPSVSVLSIKFLVQARDPIPPRERHTPPFVNHRSMDDNTLHPDFSRMFCNGVELEEDQKTMEESGVVDGDTIRFAVAASLAEDLRKCLSALIEKYPEDEIKNTSDDDKRDDMILSFFLDLDLQRGLEIEADSLRIAEAFKRGEGFTPPAEKNKNRLGSDEVEKELYKIFDPKLLPVRLYQLTKADGKSQYVGFAVEAKKTKYRYKTCYGIPVTVLHSDRIKQSAVQAGPNAGNVAAEGFVTADGKKMACTAHWALEIIVGCKVKSKFGEGIVIAIREHDIVVDLQWGTGYLDLDEVERLELRPEDPETPIYESRLPNRTRGNRIGKLSHVSGYDDAVVEAGRFYEMNPTQYPLTVHSPPRNAILYRPSTFQTSAMLGKVQYKSPVTRIGDVISQPGDSNAVWLDSSCQNTVGIHCSADRFGISMTVLRLKRDNPNMTVDTTEVRRSGRKKKNGDVSRELFPSTKRQRTV